MSDSTPPLTQDPHQLPTQGSDKGGMSTGAKVGIGCGAGCLGLVVVGVIAAVVIGMKSADYPNKFDTEFAELGLTEVVEGEELRVTTPPTVPTSYKGKVVMLDFEGPVTVPIGAAGIVVQVGGEFEENVYLRAMTAITVDPDSHFKKELNVKTMALETAGAQIDGGVTGDYKAMQ